MTIKLSTTQHDAVVEVSELGYTVAKANTIKSLEGKGLITPVGNTHHKLTDAGREYLGLPAESVGELESALQGDPWKMGEQITVDEPYLELQPYTFDKDWALWERELMGFGTLSEWRNTEVWHGLTAEQIREDLDTRVPANRADKRKYAKASRKAVKQLLGVL